MSDYKKFRLCNIVYRLRLIFTIEPSPLELPLPPDITIQLLSMEAACLFLVTLSAYVLHNQMPLILPILNPGDTGPITRDLIFFRGLHWRHLL